MRSYFKLRRKRWGRRKRRQLKSLQPKLVNYLDRHVYGAWRKIVLLGFEFFIWVGIAVVSLVGLIQGFYGLDRFYLTRVGIRGGSYSEAIVGTVKSINPVLNTSGAPADLASLIFSGLTKINGQGQLAPDLAKSWQMAADSRSYTFTLKDNLAWQDGAPLTSVDVAFTVDMIQNPDVRSPLSANWQGIKYQVVDDKTITFSLPSTYSSFLSVTTVGILPKHILGSVKPANLKLDSFNQKPIGSGPYQFQSFDEPANAITLIANPHYYDQEPNITLLKFLILANSSQLLDSYAKKQVSGLAGVLPSNYNKTIKFDNLKVHSIAQPAYIGLFFNLKNSKLANLDLRKALALATNRQAIIDQPDIYDGQAKAEYYPLLSDAASYNTDATKLDFNINQARQAMAATHLNDNGQKPSFNLITRNTPELVKTAEAIKEQWAKIGVSLSITAVDLDSLQQSFIRPRNYDILLYGQNLGLDADAYNFWHSSQVSDPGLNLSLYKSPEADKVLESARLAKDPTMRSAKFTSFVKIWSSDVPAIILFSPDYLYAQSRQVTGLDTTKLIEPTDRFWNIRNWAVKYRLVTKKSVQ